MVLGARAEDNSSQAQVVAHHITQRSSRGSHNYPGSRFTAKGPHNSRGAYPACFAFTLPKTPSTHNSPDDACYRYEHCNEVGQNRTSSGRAQAGRTRAFPEIIIVRGNNNKILLLKLFGSCAIPEPATKGHDIKQQVDRKACPEDNNLLHAKHYKACEDVCYSRCRWQVTVRTLPNRNRLKYRVFASNRAKNDMTTCKPKQQPRVIANIKPQTAGVNQRSSPHSQTKTVYTRRRGVANPNLEQGHCKREGVSYDSKKQHL